ncbi:MAG: complex I subunit 5 family protein, partial [Eubacteriales bacterium]
MSFILPMIFIFPFLAAFISFFIGRKSERACGLFSVISCGITLVLTIICIFTSYGSSFEILGYSLVFEGFHAVYAAISAFMWFCSALISPKYFEGHGKTRGYYFFFLLTEGALLGMFISADLFTVFVFFEMMSFASYTWVTHEKTEKAMAAGRTYLTVSVIGGMAMLMGLFMLYTITGTLEIYSLYDAVCAAGKSTKLYISAFLMLCGFGAKAGLFPLHIWLPKAHPVAPAPASALLSGVLTKAGVFGIIVITGQILRHDRIWGLTLLVLALITMVLGAVLALMSIDLKRVLACSSLSQIGFILVGVSMIALLGEENFLAANGTFLYMINHSLVKLVLFLSAGAIYMKAHTLDINRLRGFGRKKPLLAAVFLVGASSLSGLPGFCGYISKTLVHESIVEFSVSAGIIGNIIEWLFLISGGFTLAYMIKLFVAIFIEKPCEEHEKSKISTVVYTSLVISALSLIPFGLFPHAISEKVISFMLPLSSGGEFEERIDYFSFKNLSGILISIAIGVAVYFLIVRMLL